MQAVEQKAGAVYVELVGSEPLHHFPECALHLVGVPGRRQVEAAAGAAGVGVSDRLAVRTIR